MRTKTLLIAAAAMAVGIISSQAQSVYSQNIVGYVNTTLPNGYTMASNPLLNGDTTNSADNVLISGIQVGDGLLLWNGGGFTGYVYVGPGGNAPSPLTWQDAAGNPAKSPLLTPGLGFFYQNGQGVSETNTFVGTVVLTNQISLPNGYSMVASTVPITDVGDGTNLNLPLQVGDGILTWNGGGYTGEVYVGPGGNAPSPLTWQDAAGNPVAGPTIPPGIGFFYQNGQGVTETWNQNVVVQ